MRRIFFPSWTCLSSWLLQQTASFLLCVWRKTARKFLLHFCKILLPLSPFLIADLWANILLLSLGYELQEIKQSFTHGPFSATVPGLRIERGRGGGVEVGGNYVIQVSYFGVITFSFHVEFVWFLFYFFLLPDGHFNKMA